MLYMMNMYYVYMFIINIFKEQHELSKGIQKGSWERVKEQYEYLHVHFSLENKFFL